MSDDAEPIPPPRERTGGNRYPRVMTATVWNGAQKSTVAVRSVLIYDQRSAAREALTHAITAALSSVIHIGCVADASDLSTAFAGNPADLVLIGLQDATAGTVAATEVFLQRYPSAPVIVYGAVDDTPVLAAAVARGARGLMLWPPWYGRTPVRGFSIGARLGAPSAPELTLTQRTVLQSMSQGRSNRDIAEALGISEDAVKSHAASLYRKLGARDRAHAVALGLRERLVS
jgi:DNA-binding NarL/FixJ family response regulator